MRDVHVPIYRSGLLIPASVALALFPEKVVVCNILLERLGCTLTCSITGVLLEFLIRTYDTVCQSLFTYVLVYIPPCCASWSFIEVVDTIVERGMYEDETLVCLHWIPSSVADVRLPLFPERVYEGVHK